MNLSKPIQLITVGSLLLGLFVLAALLIVQSLTQSDLGLLTIVLTPSITTLIAFGVFYFLIERFISSKMRNIYRIISSQKLATERRTEFSIADDPLEQLTRDTAEWAEKQKSQISELKEQAEFRKEFLGNLAHELKTPVFSIQGYILTLLEGGLEDESVNREFLERALRGVDRISDLLEDLDEISKFETDRFQLKIKKFDLVDASRQTFKELESKARKKNITLEFNKEYSPIWVNADKGKIQQVLTNLIGNSISYGNENGTTTVRFHTLDNRQLLVEVADDGLGMDEKHFPRLFERFYRVDKSRERNIGGSGLGLAIVKHIVEAHGQTINVRSTVDVGSTFSFTLEKA